MRANHSLSLAAFLCCLPFAFTTEGSNSFRGRSTLARIIALTSEHGVIEEQRLFPQTGDPAQLPLSGLSALRDPVLARVRVFFDALDPVAALVMSCHFHAETLNDTPDDLGEEVVGERTLIETAAVIKEEEAHLSAADMEQTLHGWQLTCEDPERWRLDLPRPGQRQQPFAREGYRYNSVSLHSRHGGAAVYARLGIETIETHRKHRLGACLGPLFSKRATLKPWLQHHAQLGVAHVTIYHALLSNRSGLRDGFGVFASSELQALEPVDYRVSSPAAAVDWKVFRPPTMRYFAGQSTVYNDCVFRHRYVYDYLLIVDSDEIVTIKAPGFQNDMPAFLDAHFPLFAASYVLTRVLYPRKCCEQDIQEEATLNFAACRHFTAADHWQGKQIVRPMFAEAISTHETLMHGPFTTRYEFGDTDLIILKHLKVGSSYGIESDLDCSSINLDGD